MKSAAFSSLLCIVAVAAFASIYLGCEDTGTTDTPVENSSVNFVNFDSVSPGVKSGDFLAVSGVTFTTGQIPDGVAVNDTITLSNPADQIEILSNDDAISSPNFAVALVIVGSEDILMSFDGPVNFVSLYSDDNPAENPDIIRLLALEPTGKANEFIVMKIDTAFDDAHDSLHVDNYLSVASDKPFSDALFQTLTEAEGFDNLTFTYSR